MERGRHSSSRSTGGIRIGQRVANKRNRGRMTEEGKHKTNKKNPTQLEPNSYFSDHLDERSYQHLCGSGS